MANKYLKAKNCEEAIHFSQLHSDFSYISGGTDLMVNKYQKNNTSKTLIDLSDISEMKKLQLNEDIVIIGSAITLSELEKNNELISLFPSLNKAIKSIASPLIRNSATIGGNLLCDNRCMYYNQSEWWREAIGNCLKCDGDICIASGGKRNCFAKMVSDIAPVLISLKSSICIAKEDKDIIIPLEEIYSGDGINPHTFSKESIVKEIIIPKGNPKTSFEKLRERKTLEFTSLSCSISVTGNNIRVVLGGVDSKPVVLDFEKSVPVADIIIKSTKKCRIIKNDLYSREYRKQMIGVFIRNGLKNII
jgi:4-hydroxybenzoyl-CoA reductase subunit beta